MHLGGNVNGEGTNGMAERQRAKEPSRSKQKAHGAGVAEVQGVRRKPSEFAGSRGWHWAETGSQAQPQPEASTLMVRAGAPGYLGSFSL